MGGLFRETSASTFLALLLIADCAFIVLHFLLFTPYLNSPLLSLGRDLGYSEIYQYMKELWIIVLLALVFSKTRAAGYSVWILLFLYLLLDDSLQFHERVGDYLSTRLEYDSILGLRPADMGELIFSAIIAEFF